MAKVGKSKTAKKKTSTAKVVTAKTVAVKATAATEKKTTKATKGRKEIAQPVAAASTEAPAKKVSQKLIETIEKRRQAQKKASGSQLFARPAGRRGRRPKGAVEYTPEHQEEDVLMVDSDAEGLEYDTGIRVKQPREEGFSLDRFEEFDEELNFDW